MVLKFFSNIRKTIDNKIIRDFERQIGKKMNEELGIFINKNNDLSSRLIEISKIINTD